MDQRAYREIISGQSRTVTALLLRFLLRIPAIFYTAVIAIRNLLYSTGCLKTHHADAIVISVGNITTGGTGKTPTVIWLCNQLTGKSAILTRGYKSTQSGKDEPAILAENCPDSKVIINSDRVAGAAEAIEKFGANVLILDDGFQHRRLHRDIDIVTIDATIPFGYGKLLPAGSLREPITSLKRAHAVIITRSDQIEDLETIEQKLLSVNEELIIARAIHKPKVARTIDGEQITLDELKGKRVFAFCAIGNPQAFFDTLTKLGTRIVGSKIYNDHYHYSNNDIDDICTQAEQLNADLVLTTQKDCNKITASQNKAMAYLEIEMDIFSGAGQIRDLIETTLTDRIPKNI
ncbi:tetraacyldisaccharide 4'-kinase [Planctomycetota bacterium]